jgi:hypothetical protein
MALVAAPSRVSAVTSPLALMVSGAAIGGRLVAGVLHAYAGDTRGALKSGFSVALDYAGGRAAAGLSRLTLGLNGKKSAATVFAVGSSGAGAGTALNEQVDRASVCP